MTKHAKLAEKIQKIHAQTPDLVDAVTLSFDEVTVLCQREQIRSLLQQLRDNESLAFDQLIDLCAVDYLLYGVYDWETNSASENGFSLGVERQVEKACTWNKPRFAVVYHLLSTTLNHRLRVKVFLDEA